MNAFKTLGIFVALLTLTRVIISLCRNGRQTEIVKFEMGSDISPIEGHQSPATFDTNERFNMLNIELENLI